MNTQAEAAEQIRTLIADNKAQTEIIKAATAQVEKIGTETDTLSLRIKALEDAAATGGSLTPELAAAITDLRAQHEVVTQEVFKLKSSTQAGDDKVPDAPAPTPANG